MTKEKDKICDLDISLEHKKLLASFVKGRSIADVAVFIDKSYNTANHMLLLWEARGWIRKVPMRNRKSVYVLNSEKVRL